MTRSKKPIIGIIGYIDENNKNKTYITVDEYYRESIILSGGIPLLILPTQNRYYEYNETPSKIERLTIEEKNDLENTIDLCDGILFAGGEKWYEHHEYIFNKALEKNKSILGICLGMQMMAIALNRKYENGIYKNIKNDTNIDHKNKPSDEYSHNINIKSNTKLHDILNKDECRVNSRHSYHIGPTHDFIISSYSEDLIPESIELPNKNFVIGVQWHPEVLIKNDDNSKKIFKAFIDSCKNVL